MPEGLSSLKIIYHEGYLAPYYTSTAECPPRVSAIYSKLSPHYETIVPCPATKEDILRVHTREHLERVQEEGPETCATALLSAGGAIEAARRAHKGTPTFAIIRPPGHHAGASRFAGFCFFNNMAVALAALRQEGRIRSAAIIDFDMHTGDGTQNIFDQDPSIFMVDIRARERHAYLEGLFHAVSRLPKVDLIAVSAGFDLYVKDWGGLLETTDFHRIGRAVQCAAEEKAGGRRFALLEGGYHVSTLGMNVLAFCRGLEGKPLSTDLPPVATL